MTIYYTHTGSTFIVPNHYDHSLDYIIKTLAWAKSVGLTVPKDKSKIKVEVLNNPFTARMLSIEFNSPTPPNIDHVFIGEGECLPNSLKY